MASLSTSRGANPHTARLWHALLALLMAAFVAEPSTAQVYREWRDTTLPVERVPKRIDTAEIPIGLYVYHYNFDRPVEELWPFSVLNGFDFLYYSVQKETTKWARYQTLLDSAPSGRQVVPFTAYAADVLSHLTEASDAREVIFYPFDSAQMRDFSHQFGVRNNVFTFRQFDFTQLNPVHSQPGRSQLKLREAVYDTGLANQVVASGLAFGLRGGQHERWERVLEDYYRMFLVGGGGDTTWYDVGDTVIPSGVDTVWLQRWVDNDSTINSSLLFEGISYGEYDRHHHRKPHFITVTGHLFDVPNPVADSVPLLLLKVWYEVNQGEQYIDSTNTLRTADTNHRFLYKQIHVARGELSPADPGDPEWDEYRESIKRIDFEREGMSGPTDTLVTAKSIDVEVVYLGGEAVAIHSIALRDSIMNLLLDTSSAGDNYRQKVVWEADTLTRHPSTGSLRPEIYNLYLQDEPPVEQVGGFRVVKKLIEKNFVYAPGDTLSSGNGDAHPHVQHLGNAEWYTRLSFFEAHLPVGGRHHHFGIPDSIVPSIREHNGGRFGIPELMRLDSVASPSYAATLSSRIADYNETF